MFTSCACQIAGLDSNVNRLGDVSQSMLFAMVNLPVKTAVMKSHHAVSAYCTMLLTTKALCILLWKSASSSRSMDEENN